MNLIHAHVIFSDTLLLAYMYLYDKHDKCNEAFAIIKTLI